ncbi:MAG: AAA family ATPase [Minicystis sp.]
MDDAGADASRRDALKREFQLLAGLAHPSLAAVHDFGVAAPASAFYFTADFVRGLPLATYAVGKTFAEVRGALIGPLAALAFLHRAGIRHGDVKPENILVGEGKGVLIDLSCASRLGKARGADGTVSGTLGFLAPEVLRGEAGDARADLYAFGKVIEAVGEVLADRLPDAVATLARRLTEDRAELRPSEASEALEALGASANELHLPAREASVTFGREAEIAKGEACLDALVRGEPGPRVVVVRGARGSGRSRLLRELKWRAELQCVTVEGFAREAGGAVAAMLARALDRGDPGAEGSAFVVGAIEEIERRGEPVVLVVDDVERLATADREAIERVAVTLRPDGAVLLLAGEIAEEARGLGSTAEACAITTGPLSEEAVRAWAADLGVGEAGSAIMRLSGGHPADVAEVAARVLAGEAACAAGMAARRTRLAAAEEAAEKARTVEEIVEAAEALELAGASARALSVLATIEAGGLAADEAANVLIRKASCLIIRGEPREALATAEQAVASAQSPSVLAAAHDSRGARADPAGIARRGAGSRRVRARDGRGAIAAGRSARSGRHRGELRGRPRRGAGAPVDGSGVAPGSGLAAAAGARALVPGDRCLPGRRDRRGRRRLSPSPRRRRARRSGRAGRAGELEPGDGVPSTRRLCRGARRIRAGRAGRGGADAGRSARHLRVRPRQAVGRRRRLGSGRAPGASGRARVGAGGRALLHGGGALGARGLRALAWGFRGCDRAVRGRA